MQPLTGPVAAQSWSVRALSAGAVHKERHSVGQRSFRTPYEYFMAIFTHIDMFLMVRLTSKKFEARDMLPKEWGELLKLIRVTVLATHYALCARADLSATKSHNKFPGCTRLL